MKGNDGERMRKLLVLALGLMLTGTVLIIVSLPLQFWSMPEEPGDPPQEPDYSKITDPLIRETQRKVYEQAMEAYREEQAEYDKAMSDWAYA